MARIKTRVIFWDESPSEDAVGTRVFYGIGQDVVVNEDSAFKDFPKGTKEAALEIVIPSGTPDEVVSFKAASVDDAGNASDLYQHAGWKNVPFDVVPPLPVSGGGIR